MPMAAIVEKLIEIGTTVGPPELIFDNDPQVGGLIREDPFAFLLAASVDRGMVAETAWRLPTKLKAALGHLDPAKIAKLTPEEMQDVLRGIDGKPRYLTAAARTLVHVADAVVHEYDGDARNLWRDQSAASIKSRMERFYGVGPGIAAMVVILLDVLNEVTLDAEDYAGMDPKPDVHVKRVFARLGLCSSDPTEQDVIDAARRLHPSYPGKIDSPAWHIGRTWCHAQEPNCSECPMSEICPRLV